MGTHTEENRKFVRPIKENVLPFTRKRRTYCVAGLMYMRMFLLGVLPGFEGRLYRMRQED